MVIIISLCSLTNAIETYTWEDAYSGNYVFRTSLESCEIGVSQDSHHYPIIYCHSVPNDQEFSIEAAVTNTKRNPSASERLFLRFIIPEGYKVTGTSPSVTYTGNGIYQKEVFFNVGDTEAIAITLKRTNPELRTSESIEFKYVDQTKSTGQESCMFCFFGGIISLTPAKKCTTPADCPIITESGNEQFIMGCTGDTAGRWPFKVCDSSGGHWEKKPSAEVTTQPITPTTQPQQQYYQPQENYYQPSRGGDYATLFSCSGIIVIGGIILLVILLFLILLTLRSNKSKNEGDKRPK